MDTDPTDGLAQDAPTRVSATASLLEAMKLLASDDVDSALVVDDGEVVGVFSLRRLPDLVIGQRFPRGSDQVEGWVAAPEYYRPDEPLDYLMRRLAHSGVVLLGTPTDVSGVLTLRSVTQFAHPFLVIGGIERALREAITLLIPADDRGPVFAEALGPVYGQRPPPNSVDRLTISDYRTLLSHPSLADTFRPVYGGNVGLRLDKVGDLRNSLFHFRGALRASDLHFLEDQRRFFRERLDRELRRRAEPQV